MNLVGLKTIDIHSSKPEFLRHGLGSTADTEPCAVCPSFQNCKVDLLACKRFQHWGSTGRDNDLYARVPSRKLYTRIMAN